jgi:LPXTG-motif cell wall-anchored protein
VIDVLGGAAILALNLTTDVTDSTEGLVLLGIAIAIVVVAVAYTRRRRR